MASPRRPFAIPLGLLITLVALAFSSYVAIDNDLRTLVWEKWKGDVPYELPGGERHISIKVEIEGQGTEMQIPPGVSYPFP